MMKLINIFIITIIFFASFNQLAHASTIASDTFTNNDATELNAHNNTWMRYTGFDSTQTVSIQNNMAISNSDSLYTWHANGELTTQTVSFDLKTQLDQDRGYLIIYRNDTSNSTGFYGRGIDLVIHTDGSLSYHNEVLNYSGTMPAGTVQNNNWYNFRVIAEDDTFTAYLNNLQLLSGTINLPETFATGNGGFELRQAGSTIDNFLVSDQADLPNTPLNVQSLKQTSEPWQGQIYDSANLWNPANSSIKSWGCALTSAAMVLNYHGLFKLPNSAVITPGTLNTWLKNERDGYVRNGLVNWLAISRLSKKAKQSGYNENFHYDALEFNRLGSNSKDQLKADLENGIPGILEESGHFIVAKGETDTSFLINDPFYDRLTLSDGYQDSYLSLLRFVPSNTDLSYFMFIGDHNLSLNLLDPTNNPIGNSFTGQPIQNPLDQTQRSGEEITEFLSKNPTTGDYRLVVNPSTPSVYSLDLYLYDKNGEPYIKSITGFATPTKPDTLLLSFDHENSTNITTKKITTYASVIEDIKEAIILNQISKGLGNNLILQIKLAEKLHPKRKPQSLAILRVTQQLLAVSKGSLLKPDAHTILNEDIKSLISTF